MKYVTEYKKLLMYCTMYWRGQLLQFRLTIIALQRCRLTHSETELQPPQKR